MKKKKKLSKQRVNELVQQAEHRGKLLGYDEGFRNGRKTEIQRFNRDQRTAREEAITKLLASVATINDAIAHLIPDIPPLSSLQLKTNLRPETKEDVT